MFELGQGGGGVVTASAYQLHVVQEVPFVEGRQDLTGGDCVSLVDGQIGDSSVDLERQVDLADVDVALQDEPPFALGQPFLAVPEVISSRRGGQPSDE
jgi:hypothetical protein